MDAEQSKTLIFNAEQIGKMIEGITSSIHSEFFDGKKSDVAFIGIQQGGIPLANRIAKQLCDRTNILPKVGTLDISMYRDDIGMRKTLPRIKETRIPFDINGKIIILTDDVLQTGRSIRAALDAITDFGRPSMIRLAVMIDRGLREFPIRADYVGTTLSVSKELRVHPYWSEYTGMDAVCSMPRTQQCGV